MKHVYDGDEAYDYLGHDRCLHCGLPKDRQDKHWTEEELLQMAAVDRSRLGEREDAQ
jgi:hypothetical protein